MKTLTPFGVKDLLPADVALQNKIVDTVRLVFEKFGFEQIITSSIEYYDSLKNGLGEALERKTIKFFDSENNTLMLRPDFTTPIARVVANRMKNYDKPIKLYYVDPVFRKERKGCLDEIELFQAGIELIGAPDIQSDAQVIRICIELLLALGFKDFGVDIGHIGLVDNFTDDQKKALIENDFVKLGYIPKRGGVEIVSELPELEELYLILKEWGYEKYIQFNRGLIKDINYYTGMVFECFVKDFGKILGSGGRYDDLIGKFDLDMPAVGFSIDVNTILEFQAERNKNNE